MANTAPAVMIPLKLQLDEVQGQLNNLKQKISKTVDPDTAAYKQLINILGKAENSFINISAASREAFHSEADINKFKKQIQTLMTTLNSLGIKFETLNFKDLGLKDTPELENFKKQLEIVQERIKSLKAQKIGDIFDDDMGKPIKELAKSLDIKMNKNTGFDKLITDFDNAAKAAKKSVSDQTIALEDLEDQIKQFNDQELINLAEQFKKNSAPNDVVTDSLDFETIRRNFVQRFTEAFGSTDFPEILKQALDSTENVNSIEYLDNIIEAVKISKTELVTRREEWEAELERLKTKSEEVEAANKTVKTTIETQSSEANITSLTNQISALSQKVKELERFLASEAKTQANVNKEINKASASFSKMGDEINSASHQLRELTEAQERISNIKSAIKNWLGFSEVVNITKNALRDAFNNIKELDATMTQIAVVTDMSQSELWDQVSTYSAIAKQYGATTQGVYEVSQLYYQQGLDTASVMELTTETLKLATIANVDYADATDYMTVAIRGFKMEMTDAQNVVDVYSNLAAITASDVEELAVAMSKTASSAEAVGASFENTSAMIALMVNFLPLIIEKLY